MYGTHQSLAAVRTILRKNDDLCAVKRSIGFNHGPSPGLKCLLALSHLKIYEDTMLDRN